MGAQKPQLGEASLARYEGYSLDKQPPNTPLHSQGAAPAPEGRVMPMSRAQDIVLYPADTMLTVTIDPP